MSVEKSSKPGASTTGTTKKSKFLNVNIGILGHVDSGKTSLVKALSTSLSTAALDKNPQSQARGITIDLGFSAFQLPIPEHLKEEVADKYESIQFTLVDCPGHASLIRTIIGGAQIIDMMILVVDANKGIQTQTAECIIIGEMTTEKLIIVVNKIDLLPADDREAHLEKVTRRLRRAFSTTKFRDAPIVTTAAAVGGEKVASIGAYLNNQSSTSSSHYNGAASLSNVGVDNLISLIQRSVKIPVRHTEAPFYYAVDHCFAIKGHGTVLTGTVLSGSITPGTMLEFPELQLQRKVKSMQMFHKTVKYVQQGDRVGMCVTNLDPNLIERGIAAAPNSVPLLSTMVCLVKKIRFFKQACRSGTKFHITVGHTTVIAKVTFFGQAELARKMERERVAAAQAAESDDGGGNQSGSAGQSTLSALSYSNNFPAGVGFDFNDDFEYQDEVVSASGDDQYLYGKEPVQWALLELQTPVYCPLGSLVIGSRLDMDNSGVRSKSKHHTANMSVEELDRSIPEAPQPEPEPDAKTSAPGVTAVDGSVAPVAADGGTVVEGGTVTAPVPVTPAVAPVAVPSIAASNLSAITVSSASNQAVKQCRLAFYGPVKSFVTTGATSAAASSVLSSVAASIPHGSALRDVRLFRWKQKEGEVSKLADAITSSSGATTCSELIGCKLSSRGGNLTPFIGMYVGVCLGGGGEGDSSGPDAPPRTALGVVYGLVGNTGRFKVRLMNPYVKHTVSAVSGFSTIVPYRVAGITEGSKIILKFKKYYFDTSKAMKQDALVPLPRPPGYVEPSIDKPSGGITAAVTAEKRPGSVSESGDGAPTTESSAAPVAPAVAVAVTGAKVISINKSTKFRVTLPASVPAAPAAVTALLKRPAVGDKRAVPARTASAPRAAPVISSGATGKTSVQTKVVVKPTTPSIANKLSNAVPQQQSTVSPSMAWSKVVANRSNASGPGIAKSVDSSTAAHSHSNRHVAPLEDVRLKTNSTLTDMYKMVGRPYVPQNVHARGASKSVPKARPQPVGSGGRTDRSFVAALSSLNAAAGAGGGQAGATSASSTRGVRFAAADQFSPSGPGAVGYGVRQSSLRSATAPVTSGGTDSLTAHISPFPPGSTVRTGIIDSVKSSAGSAAIDPSPLAAVSAAPIVHDLVIISQAFRMEDNIKLYIGAPVRGPNGESGELIGPYAKMGKCKVRFPGGISPTLCSQSVDILLHIAT